MGYIWGTPYFFISYKPLISSITKKIDSIHGKDEVISSILIEGSK